MPWLDLLPSRLVGGFEGATMVLPHGRRVDSAAGNRHDLLYEEDYDLLRSVGITSVRESLRWHRIERRPGTYDSGELVARLRALRARGMRGIWSLTHFGVPDWMDIWSSEFPGVFSAYAAAVAEAFRSETDEVPIWSPVNEISYWTWAAGKKGMFRPYAPRRGPELKRQLVAAAIAASETLRAVDPRARLMHIDPVINIVARDRPPGIDPQALEASGMFEAWDMLRGTLEPSLGGRADLLDILGLNFYPENQSFPDGTLVPLDHPLFVPFHKLAGCVAARYDRPLIVAETGTEGRAERQWLRYMANEAGMAAASVPLVGFCLYPVIDYQGWSDRRHCRCGLIACASDWSRRWLRPHMEPVLKDVLSSVGR
jgi:Glycosyl hydrolase family 1